MKTTLIKDDNLRLVLSVGHENWLDNEAHHHRTSLAISTGLLALNVIIWLAAILFKDTVDLFPVLALLCLLSPVWAVVALKALWELRKISMWLNDHHFFLSRYNRSPDHYRQHAGTLERHA